MVKFDGTYVLDKSEKYVEFLTATGQISETVAKQMDAAKAVITVTVSGGKYNFSTEFGELKTSVNFSIGKPFQETVRDQKLENIASLDGNKITITTSSNGGTGDRIYEFTDSALIVAYTSTLTDVVGKRYYKRT